MCICVTAAIAELNHGVILKRRRFFFPFLPMWKMAAIAWRSMAMNHHFVCAPVEQNQKHRCGLCTQCKFIKTCLQINKLCNIILLRKSKENSGQKLNGHSMSFSHLPKCLAAKSMDPRVIQMDGTRANITAECPVLSVLQEPTGISHTLSTNRKHLQPLLHQTA